MAKIIEQVIAIRFSKLAKESDAGDSSIIPADLQNNLEQVAQELAGEGVIVEIENLNAGA
jgi:hypothetical protein